MALRSDTRGRRRYQTRLWSDLEQSASAFISAVVAETSTSLGPMLVGRIKSSISSIALRILNDVQCLLLLQQEAGDVSALFRIGTRLPQRDELQSAPLTRIAVRDHFTSAMCRRDDRNSARRHAHLPLRIFAIERLAANVSMHRCDLSSSKPTTLSSTS